MAVTWLRQTTKTHLLTAAEVCWWNWAFTLIIAKPGSIPSVRIYNTNTKKM
jgi:hypothetical protein